MRLFNICTRKDFEKDNVRKSVWYKVGIMKEADSGRRYIKLFQQPQTEFFVFDRDDEQTIIGKENPDS